MNMQDLMDKTVELKASDLHITVGLPPIIRLYGKLERLNEKTLMADDTYDLVKQIATEKQIRNLVEMGQIDLSFSNPGVGRFRVNIFRQRGSYGIALRVINTKIPSLEELGLPSAVRELCQKTRGLILVTGPTGSGKSTTLASMINVINAERNCHIITLEDPIEYLHRHNKSVINQREVGGDTNSFANGLRAALRQDPDIILVGEMRDLETIATAITAAETGHLVLSTLHTQGAAKTIDRIIDVFPPHQQQQIKIQLASVVEGVISQQLLERGDIRGRVAAFEIMLATNAIRNLIRDGKTHQIQTAIQTGMNKGMHTMDHSLIDLYRKGWISKDNTLNFALDYDLMKKEIGL